MYLKISISDVKLSNYEAIYSVNLLDNEKIINIEVIDKDRLLILIDSNDGIRASIYDISKNQIIYTIVK